MLQPLVVPRKLLSEVPESHLSNPGASGSEAVLKPSSAEGQKDKAAMASYNQSTSYLRLVNSQELAVNALKSLVSKIAWTCSRVM